MSTFDQILGPGGCVAFDVSEGDRVKIAQVEGGQAADVLSFSRGDPTERLSMWMSCCVNHAWKLTTSHVLVSHDGNDMWTIEADSLGENYCGGGYCRPALNARWHGTAQLESCEANFLHVLKPYGLGQRDFNGDACFNAFMKVDYNPSGEWAIRKSPAGPRDYIVLRAAMDQIVAISNCPAVATATNAGTPKPLAVEVSS
jgi:uncharacterized protein YcgI (DUF1989 family)